MKILVLCTGNSCRSQMAEAFLKQLDPTLTVFSAGTQPAERVHPLAIQVMREAGIDISQNKTKAVSDFITQDFDYVITVCGGARETCPVFLGQVKQQLHIGFDDPVAFQGSETEVLNEFRRVRDEIKSAFIEFYYQKLLPGSASDFEFDIKIKKE